MATGSRAGPSSDGTDIGQGGDGHQRTPWTVRHRSTGAGSPSCERLFGMRHQTTNGCSCQADFRTDVCLRLPGRLSSPANGCSPFRGHPREQATGSSDGYQPSDGQTTDGTGRRQKEHTMAEALSGKRQEILEFIAACLRERGYPPSVREIGEAVGLDLLGHRPHPPGGAPARGLPPARPDQAPGHPGPLRPLLQGGHGRRPGPPRPPGRRRRRRAPGCWPRRTWRRCSHCPSGSPAPGRPSCSGSAATR